MFEKIGEIQVGQELQQVRQIGDDLPPKVKAILGHTYGNALAVLRGSVEYLQDHHDRDQLILTPSQREALQDLAESVQTLIAYHDALTISRK